MRGARRNRFAFRPTAEGASLEDRVVLDAGLTTVFDLGQGVTAVVPSTAPWASTLGPPVAAQLAAQDRQALRLARQLDMLETRQFQRAYQEQVRAASRDLRTFLDAEIQNLYAAGQPTPAQVEEFNAMVGGALNATALRVSSQAALLPGSEARLLPAVQNALLGDARNTLPARLQGLTLGQGPGAARNLASPQALQAAIGRQVDQSFRGIGNQFNSFFRGNTLARQSVDAFGQRVPIGQFLGGRAIDQFGNTLGALGSSFGTVGNTALFANGATTATPEALAAFQSQYRNALGTAAFQLGSALSVFPNASTGVIPQLQTAMFGTPPGSGLDFTFDPTSGGSGINNFGLFGSLAGLPTTATDFPTAAGLPFTDGFAGFTGPLSNFFGLPATQAFNLPTGNFTNVLGQQFLGNNFAGGFNTGFGSGFPGFGTAPTTGFNPNFANGFNNFVGGVNPTIGFTLPTIATTPIGGVGGGSPIGGNPGTVPTTGGGGLNFPVT